MRPDGGVRIHFNRHHFPLGVVDDDEFDGTVDTHVVNPSDHLLLFSDGLIEQGDAEGAALGVEGLARSKGLKPMPGCRVSSTSSTSSLAATRPG